MTFSTPASPGVQKEGMANVFYRFCATTVLTPAQLFLVEGMRWHLHSHSGHAATDAASQKTTAWERQRGREREINIEVLTRNGEES